VNIQLNIVTCSTYPGKVIRDMLLHCLTIGRNCHTAKDCDIKLPIFLQDVR